VFVKLSPSFNFSLLFLLLTCSFLLDQFCEQRSWFHFIGEPTFLCKDILSKILNYLLVTPFQSQTPKLTNTPHRASVFAQLLPKIDLFAYALMSLYMLQTSFQRLLKGQGGKEAVWEYPFAVAGVNITFMIMQMLDLDASTSSKLF